MRVARTGSISLITMSPSSAIGALTRAVGEHGRRAPSCAGLIGYGVARTDQPAPPSVERTTLPSARAAYSSLLKLVNAAG